MSAWFIYILECSDDSLYTGITTNLERRIEQHNTGVGAKYTRMKRPVKLVYKESCADRSAASKREYEIKQLTHVQKQKIIAR